MRFVLSVNEGYGEQAGNVTLWLNGTKVMETTRTEIESQCERERLATGDTEQSCLTILKDVGVTVLNEDNEAYTITADARESYYEDQSGRRVAGSDHSCAWARGDVAQTGLGRVALSTDDPLNHVTWAKKNYTTKVSTLALFRRSLNDDEIRSLFTTGVREWCSDDDTHFFHTHALDDARPTVWDKLELKVRSRLALWRGHGNAT